MSFQSVVHMQTIITSKTVGVTRNSRLKDLDSIFIGETIS